MVFEILLFFIGAISGAIGYELFFKTLLGPSKNCDDFANTFPLGPPAAIQLQARCCNSECDFRTDLAIPPRPHDLISWGDRVPVSFRETEWPICPKCGELALMCMTLDWVEMKECRPDPDQGRLKESV